MDNITNPTLKSLFGVIKTHKPGRERLWSPGHSEIRFSIKSNGEITFTRNEEEDIANSLGTVKELQNIPSVEAIKLLANKISAFDKSVRDSNGRLLRVYSFDGSMKIYDSMNSELLGFFSSLSVKDEFSDPNIIAQFSVRRNKSFRQNTSDVTTALNLVAEESGGYPVNYKYFPASDILLIRRGVSENPE